MAFFSLQCTKCRLRNVEWMKRRLVPPPLCGNCGGEREYQVNVSARVVEVIDNGLMTRPVEQLQDVEKLHQDRAEKYEGRQEEVVVKTGK